ncbi:HisA/HisF family protein [Methanobacterium sp.]|uniref:HisA/HisF family protein n=1 Tax=Methanobacterium sp. TaxID=2164 RepID=UPI003D66156D
MIIPVLDLKDKIAVSGKSGKRDTYKPLKTVFCDSSNPCKIGKTLSVYGAKRMYIADLNAIEGKGSNFDVIKKINEEIPVMLDCGANNVKKVEDALEIAHKVIVATETLEKIEDLHDIFNNVDKNRLIISVDIKDNELFSKHLNITINEFIEKINELEPSEIIILDISKVGTESGANKELIQKFMELPTSLIIGGGLTSEYIDELEDIGLNKFLVGSTLHNGKLAPEF